MKRILALLMTLMMLVSCLPAYADSGAMPAAAQKAQTCDHQWFVDPMGRQTCTEGCPAVRFCRICGRQENITLPPLGHDWGDWHTTVAPTCEKDGKREHTCRRCGLHESETVKKLGHDYGPWEVTTEPTCTEKGVKATHCRRCGLLWDEDLEPLGHDWGEWYVVYPPVGMTPGLEERMCQRCGITEQREIPGSGEMPVMNPALFLELVSATEPMAEGDNVHSLWKVTNVGDADINVCLYTFRMPGADTAPHTFAWVDEGATVGDDGVMQPGETMLFSVDFAVNAADAAAGHAVRVATARGYLQFNGGNVCQMDGSPVVIASNEAELELPLAAGWLEVTKTIVNQPADGVAFVPGEVIHYLITVTNASPVPMTSTLVYDTLYGTDPLTDLGALEPGQTASCTFDYTVTEWDAGKTLLNTAVAVGTYQPGRTLFGSAEVECLTHPGKGPAFAGVLTKTEVSVPNGGYYRAGDVIEYAITLTNTGDVSYSDVDFFDSQTMESIGSVHGLNPGENYPLTWTHKVTEEEVGVIIHNTAYADVYTDDGCTLLVSETVKSPTGGDDDDHDDFDLPAVDDDSCVRTLVKCGAEGYTYELHFCGRHAGTQKDVLILIPEGADPEVEAAAWEYAAGYWKDAVADLYAELYDAAGGAARSDVMQEQRAFTVMADNLAKALKTIWPAHPEKAAYLAARLWENKCVDLCWLLRHGSEQRPDHLTDVTADLSGTACGIAVTEAAADHDRYADSLCPVHVSTDKLCRLMLRQNGADTAWAMTAALWQREADKQLEKAWRNAEEADRPAVRTAANSFETWLAAQRALYSRIYAPAVVDEISARSAMELVLMLCQAN